MRSTPARALLLAALVVSGRGSAQLVEAFTDLPLRINGDNQVRVVDQSGARITGRVVRFGRDGLTITTDVGCAHVSDPKCGDGVIMIGGLGAGVGAIIGAVLHSSTVVDPDNEARVSVSPAILRGGAGLRATLRFWRVLETCQ